MTNPLVLVCCVLAGVVLGMCGQHAHADKTSPTGIECFPPMHAITQGLEDVNRIRVAEEAQEHRLEEIRDLLKKRPSK